MNQPPASITINVRRSSSIISQGNVISTWSIVNVQAAAQSLHEISIDLANNDFVHERYAAPFVGVEIRLHYHLHICKVDALDRKEDGL